MKAAIVGSLVLLAGCAGAPPMECHDYDRLGAIKTVCVGSTSQVDKFCYDPNGKEDNGQSSRFRDRTVKVKGGSYEVHDDVEACWFDPTLYVSRTSPFWVWLHEFCHAGTALSRAECELMFPRRD